MFDDSDECATAAELGDFEFERKFLLGAMPPEAAGDPSPDLIVQAMTLHHGLTVVPRDASGYEEAGVSLVDCWSQQ